MRLHLGIQSVAEAYIFSVSRERASHIYLFPSGRGRVIITGSGAWESSREDDILNHGVFTYYFIEGIKSGMADLDGDGLLSCSDIFNYTYREVTKTPCKSLLFGDWILREMFIYLLTQINTLGILGLNEMDDRCVLFMKGRFIMERKIEPWF